MHPYRNFHMSSSLRRRFFFIILLFLAGSVWTYFMLRRVSAETSWQESMNQPHKSYRTLLQEPIMDYIPNDIEDTEFYPLDIRYMPVPILEKFKENLPQAFENDWKYMHLLKKMLQEEEMSRDIEFEEDFLRTFLTSSNYKIDVAFSKILNYLELRRDHNYFFHNVSFDFTQNPAYRFVSILPHRRKDGSVTIVFRLGKWNPDEVPFEHLKQIKFLLTAQQLRNPVTQASGFNIIYDFEDAGMRYMKYGTPQNLHLLHHVSFEVMPVRFVGYHLININFIGNMLVSLSRPFLPKHIEKIFYTHSSVNELLDFYPRSILPVEFGGDLIDSYPADWIRNANKEHGNLPASGWKNVF